MLSLLPEPPPKGQKLGHLLSNISPHFQVAAKSCFIRLFHVAPHAHTTPTIQGYSSLFLAVCRKVYI